MNKNHYTIIDLGSNSFHMLTVTKIDNGFSVFSKSKQKVRLASGLDPQHNLNQATMARGWSCLQQFSDELTELKPRKVLITATAALRLAKNKQQFIERAETILEHPIRLISGLEEAKTIYRGVAFTEQIAEQLLVIDIGGASTELIIGKGKKIHLAESLHMGCVTWLNKYFADQKLNNNNFNAAINAAKEIIKPQIQAYTQQGWTLTMGASGPICWHMELENFILIGLDSLIQGKAHGELSRQNLKYLEDVMDVADGKPLLVGFHHPPVTIGLHVMDQNNLWQTEALTELLERYEGDIRLITGHVHRSSTSLFANRICLTCPGPSHAVSMDLREDAANCLTKEPGAFMLHEWRDGFVSHVIPVGRFDGPHPFYP